MQNNTMARAMKTYQRRKVEYAALRNRGVCTSCKKRKSSGEMVWCDACREQKRGRRIARYHERKAAGLCVECGGESDGLARCGDCRLARKVRESIYVD